MEKPHEINNRVQISRAVFDGLEFIRQSGVTNMFDRPAVLQLAREWNFTETADWIERVTTRTYSRLILQGPDVIEADLSNQESESDLTDSPIASDLPSKAFQHEVTDHVIDMERARWNLVISDLGKRAALIITDAIEIERMGVVSDPLRRTRIAAERIALSRNLAEASNMEQQLTETIKEIQRGIKSLQYMIDPDSN